MDLAVETRQKFGKAVKALGREGLIPAELYGHGIANLHLAVKRRDFEKVFKDAGESTVIKLKVGGEKPNSGEKELNVLVHDIQRNYLSDEISHIDFYQVRMDELIKAHIPLEFTGESPAVKGQGGILNKTLSEIEVEALPGDLPRQFEVNLGNLLELNQSIYVKDLEIPAKVKVLVEPETVLVTVTPPLEEEVIEAPVDVTAVKVEAEEKVAERAKGKIEEPEKPKS